MAIYHCTVKTIGRSSGRSSVGSAAYRAGEKLHNKYDGVTHDYSKRKGVIHNEIMLPKNAPQDYSDRATLWNAIEEISIRKDARTAREIEVAIPIEFNRPEGLQVIRDYVNENFVEKGMCADIAIHDSDGNPHAHIMLTTRNVDKDGFGGTNRDWNKKEYLENWRKSWADVCNEHLKQKSYKTRIDHRTLEAQGIDRKPTIHMGTTAHKLEQRGISTKRGQINKEIQRNNNKESERQKTLKERTPRGQLKGIEALRARIEERKGLTAREIFEKNKQLEKIREIEKEYER